MDLFEQAYGKIPANKRKGVNDIRRLTAEIFNIITAEKIPFRFRVETDYTYYYNRWIEFSEDNKLYYSVEAEDLNIILPNSDIDKFIAEDV